MQVIDLKKKTLGNLNPSSLRPAICQQDCSNSPGSFRCICREGFTQDPEVKSFDFYVLAHKSSSLDLKDPTSCFASSCPTLATPEGSTVSCSRQSQVFSFSKPTLIIHCNDSTIDRVGLPAAVPFRLGSEWEGSMELLVIRTVGGGKGQVA